MRCVAARKKSIDCAKRSDAVRPANITASWTQDKKMTRQNTEGGGLRRLFRFTPLSDFGKNVLCSAVPLVMAANVIIAMAAGADPYHGWLEAIAVAVLVLFAWHPPLASLVLALSTIIAMLLDYSASYVVALAAATGLVVYSCTRTLIVCFGIITALWIATAQLVANDLHTGGSLVITGIALCSGVLGYSFRRGHAREQLLTEEHRIAIAQERERIADELHNIIAHDLTIIVTQARAFPLAEDQCERDTMIDAIGVSAQQALTDIRRMLKIVMAEPHDSLGSAEMMSSIEQVLQKMVVQLSEMGIETRLELIAPVSVSQSINAALVHIANESASNIVKHARSATHAEFALKIVEDQALFTAKNDISTPDDSFRNSEHDGTGLGLRRMAERAEALGGTFRVSIQDGCWVVSVSVPRT